MAGTPTSTNVDPTVTLRDVEPGDAGACAQICFDAFGDFHDHHRFPRDFPVLEAAAGLMSMWIPHPSVWGIVAEQDEQVVGSNFLDERDPIRGVGPITVDPARQSAGLGRRLMEAVLERGEGAAGIRLLQDGFNMRSLALYESLGFDVKEPVGLMSGRPAGAASAEIEVRSMRPEDVEEGAALCERVHGYGRPGELTDAVNALNPFVAVRDGRITAYASSVSLWPMNHGVAESDEDMRALLLGAAAMVEEPISLLVPLRWSLFRWCLGSGLRLVKPMNLMTLGRYHEPQGPWFPSVIY